MTEDDFPCCKPVVPGDRIADPFDPEGWTWREAEAYPEKAAEIIHVLASRLVVARAEGAAEALTDAALKLPDVIEASDYEGVRFEAARRLNEWAADYRSAVTGEGLKP